MTENLISLERGTGELLLLNSFYMRPLYVARGRERIKQVLAKAINGFSLEELKTACAGDADLVQMLRDHRIIIDAKAEKERYDQVEIAAMANNPRPINRMTVYLLLTESCNLGCIYCLNGAETYHKDSHSEMSPQVAIDSIAACLEQITPGGTLEVAFFGGEPLLNWPLVQEVIRRCEGELQTKYSDKKITFHLTSNLTICPPELIEQIQKHKITVMCDIDGPVEIHNRCRPYRHGGPSHTQTVKTIRRLVDAGISIALRATIISLNQDHIFAIAEHHKELGASNSAFVPVCPINSDLKYLPAELLPDPEKVFTGLVKVYHSGLWDKKRLFPFNQYLLKLRPGSRQVTACAAPSGTTPVIRANGDVYLCIYLVGQEKFRFGTLGNSWDRQTLAETTKTLHVDTLEDCRVCPWRYACGGGCPVMKLAPFADGDKNTAAKEYGRRINCDFTQAILGELLWDMADEVKNDAAGKQQQTTDPAPELNRLC